MHIMDFTTPLKYIAIRLTAADYVEITESQYWLTLLFFGQLCVQSFRQICYLYRFLDIAFYFSFWELFP